MAKETGVNVCAMEIYDKIDWDAIRAEYIGGGTTYRRLAKKYGVGLTTIAVRASEEGWTKDREAAKEEARDLAIQKTADQIAENSAKLEYARTLMIDKVIHALETMPEGIGNRVRQQQKGKDGKSMTVDFDILKLVSALEKLSNVSASGLARQQEFVKDNGGEDMLDGLFGVDDDD